MHERNQIAIAESLLSEFVICGSQHLQRVQVQVFYIQIIYVVPFLKSEVEFVHINIVGGTHLSYKRAQCNPATPCMCFHEASIDEYTKFGPSK